MKYRIRDKITGKVGVMVMPPLPFALPLQAIGAKVLGCEPENVELEQVSDDGDTFTPGSSNPGSSAPGNSGPSDCGGDMTVKFTGTGPLPECDPVATAAMPPLPSVCQCPNCIMRRAHGLFVASEVAGVVEMDRRQGRSPVAGVASKQEQQGESLGAAWVFLAWAVAAGVAIGGLGVALTHAVGWW